MPDREIHELACSYALGALNPDEKIAFEEHLREGCESCEAEWRSFETVSGELAKSVAQEPAPSLRQRLLSKVEGVPRIPGIILDSGGVLVSRPDEMAWQALAPGIEFKLLSKETERRYSTCLVRMVPGARYPRHRHGDVEELFMLSGDLSVADDVMRAGDYCRAEAGTIHNESFTEFGCLFLVRASHGNEMLA